MQKVPSPACRAHPDRHSKEGKNTEDTTQKQLRSATRGTRLKRSPIKEEVASRFVGGG